MTKKFFIRNIAPDTPTFSYREEAQLLSFLFYCPKAAGLISANIKQTAALKRNNPSPMLSRGLCDYSIAPTSQSF